MFGTYYGIWVEDKPWWIRKKYRVCLYYSPTIVLDLKPSSRKEAMREAEDLNQARGYGPYATFIYEKGYSKNYD